MFISIMMWPWCHTSNEQKRDVCGLVVWVNAVLVFTSSWMCFCPTVSLKMEYRYKRVCECKCRWVGGYAYVGGWLGVCVCVCERVRVCGWWYVLEVYERELHDLRIEQMLCASLLPRSCMIPNDSFKMASFSTFATTVHVIPKWHYHACFVDMCYAITLTSVPLFLPQFPVDPPEVIM